MSNEYNTIAESVHQKFHDELIKYEGLALEAAVKMARNHGLEESAARQFVYELLHHRRQKKIAWRASPIVE